MHRRQRKMDHPNHRLRSRPHRTRMMVLHHYQRPRRARHHVHLSLPSLSERRIQSRTSHLYAQQWTMSHVTGNKKPDPRQDFITDLIQLVKNKQSIQTMAININLDVNKQMGDEANGLQCQTTLRRNPIRWNRPTTSR
jgi:hypothetical protein